MKRQDKRLDYPRVEKILDDGTIIAYDKYNQLNTDLNVHTLTDAQQHQVFGGILINTADQQNKYYTDRDYRYEQEQREALNQSKSRNKWLLFGFIIILLLLVVFIVKSCSSDDTQNETFDQNNATTNSQQTPDNNKSENQYVEQKDKELQQQIQDTKDSIKNNHSDTQSKIDQLKQEIENLKNHTNDKQANKVANQYDDTVDNLQNAEKERQNGNNDAMEKELEK
ncbi:hypothetical protein [Staphylococcus coagulans]|nr:hypothetical protein [Staphylococcus coagulans]MBT2811425.1 hypothetical protein [Staphylococcus coagulans]